MSNRHVQDRRFRFGDNWLDFARGLGADQVAKAESSLRRLLQRDSSRRPELSRYRVRQRAVFAHGSQARCARAFVRFRCGFGRVAPHACATSILPADREWTIEQGSILEADYVRGLGTFDVVYAWGVLHHTGALHHALGAAARLVAPGGLSHLRSIIAP